MRGAITTLILLTTGVPLAELDPATIKAGACLGMTLRAQGDYQSASLW
jgi:hypothetical protein